MYRSLRFALLPLALLAGGCSSFGGQGALGSIPFVYYPPVQQGNVVTQEMVNQLRPGMSKSQVSYIMGTPTLVDAFHQDRWDYYYRMVEDGIQRQRYRLTLYFEGDKLSSMDGDFRPRIDTSPQQVEEKVYTVPDLEE